jgi:DNA-binding MarR family transcriptional regulator
MSSDVLDAIFDLRRSLSRGGTAAFSETGVGPRQVLVLRELRRAGSLSQVELSRATVMDPVSLMRALDALERRGWTRRESCPTDRRRKIVSLTPAGERALTGLDNAYEALRALANGALSPRERVQFCTLAARIAVAMQRADADAPAKA